MKLFIIAAIVRQRDNEHESCSCAEFDKLSSAIQTNIAEADRLKLNSCTWIVSFEGTANELTEKIGVRGGKSGLALLAQVEETAGFGPKSVGEWLKDHSEK